MPNAKVLESKKAVVDALTSKVKEASSVVFVDYKGITVAQDTELRKQFREAGVDYAVVKNTLTNFAAKNAGYDFSEVLNGTTAMASTTGDPIAPARIVCEFAKKNKNVLTIKGGIVEGSVLTADPKVITPDYTEYNAAKAGGTDILYNNRSFILHPNGLSFDADGIAKETPTDAEFATTGNWKLKFDHKNVRMGKLSIPKANFTEE